MRDTFLAVFRKEFLHIRRDGTTLRLALIIPIFQLVLFGFIDQTVHDLPTVVVDQDRSVESRDFLDGLRATRTFRITRITQNPAWAREEIIAGRARVGIVIPPDFHDQRARRQPAKILALIDGSDSTASAQALASVNGVIADRNLKASAQEAPGPAPFAAQPILLFNPDGRTANYIIPGLVAVILQFVALVLAAVAVVREREQGTWEQLLVTPIDPLGLTLGKLGPYLVVGFAQMTLLLFLMRWVFGVPIRGNMIFLAAMVLVYLFSLLSLGLFISGRSQSQLEAQQKAQLLLIPSFFISGYIFPFEGLPVFLQIIGYLYPPTHMIAIMRGVVLRDAGLVDLLPHVLMLLGFGGVLVWLSSRTFRKLAD
ncbi:MAG TPA: ABC transporter permease [Planctomycetota bacterium]|nr:ABC transporter permease [Planctomycetota bacterium]